MRAIGQVEISTDYFLLFRETCAIQLPLRVKETRLINTIMLKFDSSVIMAIIYFFNI